MTGKAHHLGKEKVEQMVTPCSSPCTQSLLGACLFKREQAVRMRSGWGLKSWVDLALFPNVVSFGQLFDLLVSLAVERGVLICYGSCEGAKVSKDPSSK